MFCSGSTIRCTDAPGVLLPPRPRIVDGAGDLDLDLDLSLAAPAPPPMPDFLLKKDGLPVTGLRLPLLPSCAGLSANPYISIHCDTGGGLSGHVTCRNSNGQVGRGGGWVARLQVIVECESAI